MPRFRYVVADVFTDTPLQGNQVAVFTDAREIPEERLQQLAREVNFSETTFVYPPVGDGHIRMRIFTPATELPFAGHPTLGTAFVLGAPLQLTEIRIETAQGTVPVELEREGARISFGRMQQPSPTIEPFAAAAEALATLGVADARLPVELYDNGVPHVLISLDSRDQVAGLRPDLAALERLGRYGFNCFAADASRVKTRMFGPGLGVPEDPATGSSAGPIALHLARHGVAPYGTEIEIVQGEEIGRRSVLYATAWDEQRIEVGGSAVVVARGEFQL
jgi:trans-2,3-dihydro-3-hydroxyanthranilate isomerase